MQSAWQLTISPEANGGLEDDVDGESPGQVAGIVEVGDTEREQIESLLGSVL